MLSFLHLQLVGAPPRLAPVLFLVARQRTTGVLRGAAWTSHSPLARSAADVLPCAARRAHLAYMGLLSRRIGLLA
jgi:hypothetical protein